MLKGVHPLLDAELLAVLAGMGHGDELALVDANFPSVSLARRLVRLGACDVLSAARAILTVLPLDTFVATPLVRMEVVDNAGELRAVHREVHEACQASEDRPLAMASLAREAFYERAKSAFAVVATGEQRPYGCFLLTKGVVLPVGASAPATPE